MIEIDKKVKTENEVSTRRRDRFSSPVIHAEAEVIKTQVAQPEKQSMFDISSVTSTLDVSKDLKKFDNYKSTDLEKLFENINIRQEQIKETKKKVSTRNEDLNEDFLNVTKLDTDINTATYTTTVADQYVEKPASLKINLKGKLVIGVVSVILCCLIFLAIFNAVVIGNLNKSIASLDSQIVSEERVLNVLEDAYNTLTSEEVLKQIASENGLKPINPSDVISYSPAKPVNNTENKTASNWFDKIASFFAKLLGVG